MICARKWLMNEELATFIILPSFEESLSMTDASRSGATGAASRIRRYAGRSRPHLLGDEYRKAGLMQIWEAHSGRPLEPPMLDVLVLPAATFHPDGRFIATGDWEGKARLWDTKSATPIGPALTEPGPIRAAAFGPDGRTLAVGAGDGTLTLWPIPTAPHSGGNKWKNRKGKPFHGLQISCFLHCTQQTPQMHRFQGVSCSFLHPLVRLNRSQG